MQKDRAEKYLEAHADVFADICNVLVLGKTVILPENLTDGPTQSVYKAEGGEEFREQSRDICKYVEGLGVKIALLGLENQSTVDSDMVYRIMGYDYASYRRQIDEGTLRYPVLSAVLYFGDAPWNSPHSLQDMFEVAPEYQQWFSNYRIMVVDVPRIPKEIREKMTSDFKVVADFFANRKKPDYKPSNQPLKYPEAVLELLKVFTKDSRYAEIKNEIIENKKEGAIITMCEFAERMEKRGIEQGIEYEIFRSVYEKDYSLERGAEKLELSKEIFEKKYQKWLEENGDLEILRKEVN